MIKWPGHLTWYPGGPAIDALAKDGDKNWVSSQEAILMRHPYDFSFSGLKTAVINYIHNMEQREREL